jgi:acyl-ACP thioesterase
MQFDGRYKRLRHVGEDDELVVRLIILLNKPLEHGKYPDAGTAGARLTCQGIRKRWCKSRFTLDNFDAKQ